GTCRPRRGEPGRAHGGGDRVGLARHLRPGRWVPLVVRGLPPIRPLRCVAHRAVLVSLSAVNPRPCWWERTRPQPAEAGTLGDECGGWGTRAGCWAGPTRGGRVWPGSRQAMVLERRSMASSSLMARANASSDTSTWRALTNIDFSPADRPLSFWRRAG